MRKKWQCNVRLGKSEHIRKNGKNRQAKQNYVCVNCSRQFIGHYDAHQGYSDEFNRECLRMYVNGMGFRAIERVKGVHHTTVITADNFAKSTTS